MNKSNNKTSTKKQTWSKKKITGVVAGSLIGLYVLSLFIPYFAAYSWYPIYFVKCGGQPVLASDFAAGYTYDAPGDRYYSVFATDHFFCSTQEAEAAGYRHNTLGY